MKPSQRVPGSAGSSRWSSAAYVGLSVKASASGPVDVSDEGIVTPSGRRTPSRICPVPERAGIPEKPRASQPVEPDAQTSTESWKSPMTSACGPYPTILKTTQPDSSGTSVTTAAAATNPYG